MCFSSVNATRWVDNVQNYFKKAYPNDEYILLGNDQLVGVCLVIFIRRDLAPFVKYIIIYSNLHVFELNPWKFILETLLLTR